jgi:hypothetical protein
MSTLKTLVLFGFLAILAAYVYFYEIQGGEEREKAEEIAEKIIVFEPDNVVKIELRSVFNQFLFERQGDEWRIINPVQTGADKTTIDGMMTALKNMKKVRQFSIKRGEEKDYGLVGRSSLLVFELKNGTRDSVRFGDDTPISGNVFVSKGDTIVYTVASHLKNNLSKSLFDWRNKSIARVKESEVKELKLNNKQGSVHLIKEGDDWKILSPREVSADNISVNALIKKFASGIVKSVISEEMDNPRTFNLANPHYTIDFYLGEGRAHKQIIMSELVNNTSNVKEDSRPQVMTVDSSFIGDIDKSFFDLRDKKIAAFDKNAVDSVVVSQGDSTLYFVKDTSSTWMLTGLQKVHNWKMESFLNTINNLQAENFLLEDVNSTNRYGLDRPERKITCYREGMQMQQLTLSTQKEKKVAFCPSSKVVVEIQISAYDNLEIKTADFLETPALPAGDNI